MKLDSPADLDLPFDSWRPGQRLAIRTAISAKKRIVAIQSPTGTGKSTIATGIMRADDDTRAFTLTATKGLEDQYTRIFDFLYDIRGMSNYKCLAARQEFERYFQHVKGTVTCDQGPCRSGMLCSLKDRGCTYFDAVREVMATKAGLTNYSYWLAMHRYGRGLGHVGRLLCDEAHALPEELMAANQISIPLSLLAKEGKTPRTWKRWSQWAAAQIAQHTPQGDLPLDVKAKKQQLVDTLTRLAQIDDTWAWDIREHSVTFEPTIPRLLLPSLANIKATKLVFLSATITPHTMRLLGLKPKDYAFVTMQSRFDPRRRPIYVVDTVRVDHKMTNDHVNFWIARIDGIIRDRRDRKGIIHSISYERARLIQKLSRHSGIMLAPRSSFELAATVERFRKMKPPAILLSPSVMTGWDFPYTDCEYQILVKVPFPDTRSAIARARIKATEGYREHLTMQAVEQAAGRGNRASDDSCETFIIDNHASWFLPMANRDELASMSFVEAVHYVKAVPPPLPRLT